MFWILWSCWVEIINQVESKQSHHDRADVSRSLWMSGPMTRRTISFLILWLPHSVGEPGLGVGGGQLCTGSLWIDYSLKKSPFHYQEPFNIGKREGHFVQWREPPSLKWVGETFLLAYSDLNCFSLPPSSLSLWFFDLLFFFFHKSDILCLRLEPSKEGVGSDLRKMRLLNLLSLLFFQKVIGLPFTDDFLEHIVI